MRIFMLVLMVLLLGAFFIISNENLSLGEPYESAEFQIKYYEWVGKIWGNVKSLTGGVVKSSWLP